MAKFYGEIGFAELTETRPGIWEETMTERMHYGDVLPNIRKLEPGQSINDDVVINNKLSIVADPYAQKHFFNIRYAKWMGVKWKVSNIEVQTPRLILTLGDVYNGSAN